MLCVSVSSTRKLNTGLAGGKILAVLVVLTRKLSWGLYSLHAWLVG
jgi:hypothetical protein